MVLHKTEILTRIELQRLKAIALDNVDWWIKQRDHYSNLEIGVDRIVKEWNTIAWKLNCMIDELS